MVMYGCMLECAAPPPAVVESCAAHAEIVQLTLHADAGWSDMENDEVEAAFFLERIYVDVPLDAHLNLAVLGYFGYLYLASSSVVTLCDIAGVVAETLFPWVWAGRLCACSGISLSCKAWDASPPVAPSRSNTDVPTATLPERSGRLNVVLPSPVPYRVPIAANRSEYVVRETAEPSHIRYPEGAVEPANMNMEPAIILPPLI